MAGSSLHLNHHSLDYFQFEDQTSSSVTTTTSQRREVSSTKTSGSVSRKTSQRREVSSMYRLDRAHVRLGRIRCLTRAVQSMKKGEPLPEAICFVPKELHFEYEGEEPLSVVEEPIKDGKVLRSLGKKTELVCAGQPLFNSEGAWVRLTTPNEGWVLVQPAKRNLKGKVRKLPVTGCGIGEGGEDDDVLPWVRVVEQSYSLRLDQPPPLENFNKDEITKLQTPPPGWSLEADEELAQFLVQQMPKVFASEDGSVKGSEYFLKIEASSEEDDLSNLLDNDPDSAWESDGSRGRHWLRFFMKPGTVISKFTLLVDSEDGSYLPKRVTVKCGSSPDNLSTVHTHTFGLTDYESGKLELLPYPLDMHKEVIEVHIQSCFQGGIDTRVRGVSVITDATKELFSDTEILSEENFSPEKVTRYPKLQAFEPKQLFYRGLALKRVAHLLNEDLLYILPISEQTVDMSKSVLVDAVSTIRQVWPMCKKRDVVIKQMLADTASSTPSRPVLYINRIVAKEHRDDPTAEPSGRKTVFCQTIRELKRHTKPTTYNFRWAGLMPQWWECKFIQEGLIDLGGGFRDSLADIAEELCPSSPDSPVALPLFIRSPNQSQDSSNAYRDAYVPNPSCTEFAWYHFIGQLMGAMFRSQEALVLSLSQLVWKDLVGEVVTWERDFVSVDSAEVKLVDSIETMSREKFDAAFAGTLTYTAVLSGGETVALIDDGEALVTYEDRHRYCELVKDVRMKEFRAQTNALRGGLTKVVPAEVLRMLTWQELETKICGDPEISIEALKRSTRYSSGLKESSPRITKMWKALEKFSNDDRSRLLRFITGRRRLPCTIYIDSVDTSSKLPSSATCSNTLYLPDYDSVDEAVDRLKYAAYNCVAIDTDMSPYTMD